MESLAFADSADLHERHAQKIEAIARLSRAVACEVNGPLQQAESNLRFLQQALSDVPAEVEAALSQTLQGLLRVAAGMQALQRFARPGERTRRAVDVNAALRLALTLASAEIRLGAELHADLGEAGAVLCDPADLHEVFLCLLLNAARACASAGRRGSVRVWTGAENGCAVIGIADSGGPAEREGLLLAHALIAQKHGGELDETSFTDGEVAFTVKLPLARSPW